MLTPKRVFVGSIATETNTFSPLRTDLKDFEESFYAPPGQHPDTPTLCSAVYPAARARAAEFNWQIVEGTASWAEPGGIVNQNTWEFLRDQLLTELKAAMPVDIILLGLHGAMVSQDCLDCEGELLTAIREIVGANTIIGTTFDPHSHLSKRRTDNANLISVFKEFPHTDFVEVAEELVELVHDTSLGKITPVISTFDCKMIEVLPTSREPMRSFVDKIKAREGHDSILSISVIHGFMAGDVPDLGSKIIVITDNDKSAGDKLAKELGNELFAMRGKTRPEFLTSKTVFDRAETCSIAPVVVADVWDNPGGGVPGDSTILLAEMIRRKVKNAALATIWDPIAVRTCFSAGEDAQFRLRFGAKMSEHGGDPLDADVIVKRTMRNAVQSFGQSIVPLGDAVWIEVEGIDVILNSVRSQVFNPDVFSNFGIDPKRKKLLVVKSTNHFQDAFSRISDNILYAAVDGPYPNNPKTNNYQNLNREIWPRVETPHGS
ncbi:M81 family metallopeptidase [Lentilitoribacter sp. EG35]|uniref:M81 family metallopeptidase n=1 Tax=Lentilitoribacter sp. EG35 TaxID=3234192 RepID=UPI0034603DA3